MQPADPEVSLQHAALYRATMGQVVLGAPDLMARLVAHNRAMLRAQEEQAPDLRERDRLENGRRLLNQFESVLCARFTEEVTTTFTRMVTAERARPMVDPELHFEQIAAMTAQQLQRSVETARARQGADSGMDPALRSLNSALCAHLGLPKMQLQPHPLRSAVFVEALASAVTHLPVPPLVRQGWITVMGGALGQTVKTWYEDMAQALQAKVASGVPLLPTAMASFDGAAPHSPPRVSSSLTLERLRNLLAAADTQDAAGVGHRYAVEGLQVEAAGDETSTLQASLPVAFRPTVPAALDAMREAGLVDQVAARIERRQSQLPGKPGDPADGLRAQARAASLGLEQSLGVEVVSLMIDNITQDPRLLSPVQRLVADLEPALLQLARQDPRFFSHKQHPARRLLHEITHRSIAYESVDSRGFSGFMEPLREVVAPLTRGVVETAEPFDQALTRLTHLLDDQEAAEKRQLARAVRALKKAEQRNALAATLAMDVLARPEAALVPDAILDFLCGPWAQVVAHARMSDRSGDNDPGHYIGMVDDLLWSAQPHLTRQKVSSLTRLVPKLLSQLRAGLATIDYPAHKTSQFFEVLMQLHQRGFKPEAEVVSSATRQSREALERRSNTVRTDAAWVAPAEARASGFIDIQALPDVLPEPVPLGGLKIGAWVALLADGGWTRTRLCWISGNGGLLLFSDALGFLQSLTRQACQNLLMAGKLRLISADPVEDALDAVARTAMRNSVDIRV